MKYRKTVLDNGLRILTIPMEGTKTATVVAMVSVGSRYESDKESGISHFIEHMLFKGTEKRPDAISITEELDSIGGEFNAFTSKDTTGYYAKVDSKHVSRALDVISDMYLNSKFEEKEIKKEKGSIIQEINMFEDNPMRNIGDIFENLLYPGDPLGRDIVGDKKTVGSFKRKDFLDYRERFYVAGKTVVCIAGKFDEKKILKEAGTMFSGVRRGKKISSGRTQEKQKIPGIIIKDKKTDQTHINLGVRTFGYDHKDRFALSLLSVILGGNMSSRLFLEIREKRGLAYAVRTFVESYQEAGYLAMYAGVEHGNLELTIKTALLELQKMAKDGVSDKELKNAKEYWKGKAIMNFESSDEVAMFFVDQESRNRKTMEFSELIANIEKVEKKDILRVARNIFRNDRLNLAIIGPHKNKERLSKLLNI